MKELHAADRYVNIGLFANSQAAHCQTYIPVLTMYNATILTL